MTAISLWQPWATLWLLSDPDEKVFETRHWYAAHRGPLLVHAAKTRNRDVLEALNSRPEAAIEGEQIPTGISCKPFKDTPDRAIRARLRRDRKRWRECEGFVAVLLDKEVPF